MRRAASQVVDDDEIQVYEPFQNVNNETAETCNVWPFNIQIRFINC